MRVRACVRAGENRLLVASSVKTIVWVAKDAAACDSWVKSLQMAIEKVRASRRGRRRVTLQR